MGEESGIDNSQESGQGGNPAWEEFYNAIPEDYREDVQPHVTPVLEKWDRNVQQRFESYKPYEKYVQNKVDPQVIDYAMNLLDTLNDHEGAVQVYEQLGSYLESQGLIGQEDSPTDSETNQQNDNSDVDWDQLPPAVRQQIEQLQEGLSVLAQDRVQERQKQIEAEEDAALDAELKKLHETYGDFDDEWVLVKMANGMDAEDAVKSYNEWLDNQLKARSRPQSGFKALGAGSGDFPAGAGEFNPRKATGREVQDMIAQRLMDLQRDR